MSDHKDMTCNNCFSLDYKINSFIESLKIISIRLCDSCLEDKIVTTISNDASCGPTNIDANGSSVERC